MLSNEQKRAYVKSKHPKAELLFNMAWYYICIKGSIVTKGHLDPGEAWAQAYEFVTWA